MHRAPAALLACSAVALGAVGCGSSSSSSSSSSPTPASTSTAASTPAAGGTRNVTYQNIAISPANITVKVGTKVEWTNLDNITHNVQTQSGPQKFTSPNLGQGATYTVTLTKPGVVHYFCVFHPSSMIGTITVVP